MSSWSADPEKPQDLGHFFIALDTTKLGAAEWLAGRMADFRAILHASPPADQFHTRLAKPSAATTCSACHLSVVSAAGAITFTGSGAAATTLHLDGLNQASSATCTSCPVCGSEECLMLEELGTYCRTMTAASLATRKEEAEKKH